MNDVSVWLIDAGDGNVWPTLHSGEAKAAIAHNCTVTPLVPAPPALAAHVAQRLRRRVEEAKTRGGMRVGMPRADVDANDLECVLRWLEGSVVKEPCTVPAPPEGAPTYAELVEALRDCVWALDAGFISRAAGSRKNAETLLSRLPGETEG